jgi:hypothetical protein
MEQGKILDVYAQLKRIYRNLDATMDLSRQMAEAVDRDDQVTVQMLLAMREEPIRELTNAREALKQQIAASAPEDAKRLRAILNGEATEAAEEERVLVNQVAANQRLLEQVQQLDKILNQKISREKSIYQ